MQLRPDHLTRVMSRDHPQLRSHRRSLTRGSMMEALETWLGERSPGLVVTEISGGQPRDFYQLAVE